MKPMLAAEFDRSRARFPMIVTPKIDGVRVLVKDGVALTRSGQALPNAHIQAWVKANSSRLNGLDGEIVVGRGNDARAFSNTQSGALSRGGKPDFTFHAFDRWDQPQRPYAERRIAAAEAVRGVARARSVPGVSVADLASLDRVERKLVAAGYEGAIARDPIAAYKSGRSTAREGGMLKIKRFSDAEARILGSDEMIRKDGSRGGTLGALKVERNGRVFSVGTGFSAAERADLWARRGELAGQLVKVKHMEHGAVSVPRHPVFQGLRSPLDLDAAATRKTSTTSNKVADMTARSSKAALANEYHAKRGHPPPPSMTRAQLRAEIKSARTSVLSPRANPASGAPSSRTLARAVGKIGAAGGSAIPTAAIGLGFAGAIFAASSRAAEAGESKGGQAKAAAVAGGKSLALTVGSQIAIVAAQKRLALAVPSLATKGAHALVSGAKFGLPVLGLGLAAYGAWQGYQQGGVKGAAVGAFTGGYVPPSMRSASVLDGPIAQTAEQSRLSAYQQRRARSGDPAFRTYDRAINMLENGVPGAERSLGRFADVMTQSMQVRSRSGVAPRAPQAGAFLDPRAEVRAAAPATPMPVGATAPRAAAADVSKARVDRYERSYTSGPKAGTTEVVRLNA